MISEFAREVAAVAPGKPHAFRRWTQAFLSWTPHAKQESFGQSTAKTLLLMCGIRFGKSDVAAAKFLFWMFFTPAGRFLNCSYSQDQAEIVVKRAIELAMAGPLRGFVEKVVRSPHLTLTLKNGATLQARSTDDANLLRGKTYHGINVDEGAYCRWTDFEVLMGRVMDYDGWLSVTSSPPPNKGMLFAFWSKVQTEFMAGSPRHYAETASTYDNPHIPRHKIEEMRANYTEQGFQREVMGEFVDSEGATFPLDIVNRAFQSYDLPPESHGRGQGSLRMHHLASWDLGRKTTVTAGYVWRQEGAVLRGVHRVRLHSSPWASTNEQIKRVQEAWDASTCIDGTGVGDVVLGTLDCAVTPIIFTPKSRAQMIIEAQKAFQDGAIILHESWHEARTQFLLHTWKEDAEGQTWDDFDAVIMGVHHANRTNGTLGFSVLG